MRGITCFSFLLGLVVFAGCTSGGKGSQTLAKINKRGISAEDFKKKLERIAHLPGQDLSSNSKKKELLDEMIKEELLYQAGVKEGLVENSERIRREISREYLNTQIGKDRYEPTDPEIQQYYDKNKTQLERIRASHILIKPDKPGDAASEAKAKQKAEEILALIRKQGEKADFAKFAKEYSQDTANKDRGGELFFFTRDKMVAPFSDAAFSLKKVGDVSDAVKTPFGYHIIKLTGEQRGLEFFKHSIKWKIAQDKQKEKADSLFEKLKKTALIKIDETSLAQVEVPKTPMRSPNLNPNSAEVAPVPAK